MVLTEKRLKKICRFEQKGQCRFITPGPNGLECGKGTPIAAHINRMVALNKPGPIGDNCKGLSANTPWQFIYAKGLMVFKYLSAKYKNWNKMVSFDNSERKNKKGI